MPAFLFSKVRISTGMVLRKMIVNGLNEEDVMKVALRRARQKDARADIGTTSRVVFPFGRSGNEAWVLVRAVGKEAW